VLQSPFSALPSFGIYKRNLLEARVVICSHNDHCPAPFYPSLFGWFGTAKFTRVWEPTLLWNQYHSFAVSDPYPLFTTEIHQGNLLAGMLTVLNHSSYLAGGWYATFKYKRENLLYRDSRH
jgi:hypothetical protein